MTRLCTICARGGSKGVKNKNVRSIGDLPLIAHSLKQAKDSRLFERIAVSSDSDDILRVAGEWGADYLIRRPDEMATDTAAKLPAIQHCAKEAERLSGLTFTTAVDLDATSPLRLVEDIVAAVKLLEDSGCANVLTGAPARRSPYFNLVEVDEAGIVSLSKKLQKPVVRRQDAPKCYDMNASIYVWRWDALFEDQTIFKPDTRFHEMPENRSVDIDSELDFKIVEMLLKERME
jgi:CMP-N,N'-diacetyllegionaminic acid synthase